MKKKKYVYIKYKIMELLVCMSFTFSTFYFYFTSLQLRYVCSPMCKHKKSHLCSMFAVIFLLSHTTNMTEYELSNFLI